MLRVTPADVPVGVPDALHAFQPSGRPTSSSPEQQPRKADHMNTHVIPASLRAFEDAAETAHVSGHGFFKQPLGGAHNTTVSYHSYPNAAEPAERALLLENNAGCLRTSFLDQHPSWSNMSYSTGPGTPVSMTKRFERFVQFLKDDEAAVRESVFIDCAPRCAVEDLSHEHQARIAASLSAFGRFSPAFKARFGYELLALAEEYANVTEIDAQAKRKAAETRRRRAEFKTVPGAHCFLCKAIGATRMRENVPMTTVRSTCSTVGLEPHFLSKRQASS
jgi:hypothetical protein